jgi:hypothetical protein
MQTKSTLVAQMMDVSSDRLPDRWQGLWRSMKGDEANFDSGIESLEACLDESYFDGERPANLTKEEIAQFCEIVRKLLIFEPSSRTPASVISQDPWFTK